MNLKTKKQMQQEYVLGTHDAELARLGLQHQLWLAQSARGWEKAGFARGQKILDVGCGPGYATVDLSQLVGGTGQIVGVDMSRRFLDHVETQARARGVRNIVTIQHNLENKRDLGARFDGAYARWVFCFLKKPVVLIQALAQSLRSGAALLIHDYYQYEALWVAPDDPIFRKVFKAVAQSWRMRGGNPNIGSVLPACLLRHGFEIREINPIVRLARASEPLWQWPDSFFAIYVPALVSMRLLTARDAKQFFRVWKQRSGDPGSFFSTPPMVEIIAIKK